MTERALAAPSRVARIGGWNLTRLLHCLAALVLAFGVVRIVATYSVFSHTYDEPAHIAAGMQLLDKGEFTYEPLHPPTSRIAVALGPYLAGFRSQNGGDLWIEGRRLFYGRGADSYDEIVALARLGILPFFVLAVGVAWAWSTREAGPVAGAATAILLASQPLLLGHAGLATTDVAFTATFMLACALFVRWLERPGAGRGAWLGAAVGLAVTSKMSALAYLPAAFLSVVALPGAVEWARLRRLARAVPSAGAALAAFAVVVWAIYGFNADPLYAFRSLIEAAVALAALGEQGQSSYFMGEIRDHGWWSFFPVLLAVKTPLPFLLAFGIGVFAICGLRGARDWRRMAPLAMAGAVLLVAVLSRINIGARHILPIVPLMAIVAGEGIAWLIAAARRHWLAPAAAVGLIGWQSVLSLAVHPDYLAYFNELAGDDPARIVAGSDLDWGQDVGRLSTTLRSLGVDHVALAVHTSGDLRRHDLPPFSILYPGEHVSGWVAVSAQVRAYYCAGYAWLDAYRPVAQVGRSIRLYRLPPDAAAGGIPGPADPLDYPWSKPLPCRPAAELRE
jgi:hypothetical protein